MSGWIAAASAAASLAGTAASASGQIKGGQATASADRYKAAAARNLAQGYIGAGTRAVQGGEVSADVEGLKTRENVGRAKAQQGANNVDVGSPTAVAVREGIGQAGKLNQLTVLSNSQLQNWGYRLKAQQEMDQANLDEMGAGAATTGGALGAVGSIFSGASKLPLGWLTGSSSEPSQSGGLPSADQPGGNVGGSYGGYSGTGPY